jgi:hypothetical protein
MHVFASLAAAIAFLRLPMTTPITFKAASFTTVDLSSKAFPANTKINTAGTAANLN